MSKKYWQLDLFNRMNLALLKQGADKISEAEFERFVYHVLGFRRPEMNSSRRPRRMIDRGIFGRDLLQGHASNWVVDEVRTVIRGVLFHHPFFSLFPEEMEKLLESWLKDVLRSRAAELKKVEYALSSTGRDLLREEESLLLPGSLRLRFIQPGKVEVKEVPIRRLLRSIDDPLLTQAYMIEGRFGHLCARALISDPSHSFSFPHRLSIEIGEDDDPGTVELIEVDEVACDARLRENLGERTNAEISAKLYESTRTERKRIAEIFSKAYSDLRHRRDLIQSIELSSLSQAQKKSKLADFSISENDFSSGLPADILKNPHCLFDKGAVCTRGQMKLIASTENFTISGLAD